MTNYSKRKKRIRLYSSTLLVFQVALSLSSTTPFVQTVMAAEDDWVYVKHKCDDEEKKSTKSKGEPTGVEGDWLTEGTETHKIAQKIFDEFTKTYGTSGAFAAGVLANVYQESHFVPDVGESSYKYPYEVRRFGMNNKKPVTGMGASTPASEKPGEPDYFGGGLFQFTPYTKFANSSWWQKVNKEEGWAPENQIGYLLEAEFWNHQLEAYFGRTGSNAFSNVEALISTDNPADAALYFMMAYERPLNVHPERLEWAKQANKVFNKENIKADKSKWKFGSSSGGAASSSSDKKKSDDECPAGHKDAKAGWGEDGTGTYSQAGVWKPEELPDELKKYAIDPESLGMHYSSSNGWANPGDQCAHLSETMMATLWEKDGKSLGVQRTEAGKDEADSHARAYGGSVTDQPTKGAVSGVPAGAINSHSVYGHTYIVSHRFANGDILALEQNYGGKSGAANHSTCTWNYRIITKEEYTSSHTKFFSPESLGYKPNPKVKMKG